MRSISTLSAQSSMLYPDLSMIDDAAPRVFLLDGSSYIFRAFFVVPSHLNSAGLATHAIYGFTNMILRFVKQHQPKYLAVVFDGDRGSFRKNIFLDYKATRPEAPADLRAQIPYIRRVLKALKVSLLELDGYEADDLIATVCKSLSGRDCECVIVSSDKDLMQLITDRVKLLDGAKNKWITAEDIEAKFGVKPEELVEVMGLAGDAVDNIPGVKGIGEKTAIGLIRCFHSLDNVFANLDHIERIAMRGAARVRKALENGREVAFLSRELAILRSDVPIKIELENLRYSRPEIGKLLALFADLEPRASRNPSR